MPTAGDDSSAEVPRRGATRTATAGGGGGLRQQAMDGVFWTAMEKWSVRASTLAGFIVLGNLLRPTQFGVVALAMTFITILTTVSDAGFSSYLLQAKRLTAATTSTAFWTTAALALFFSVTLAALAGPISVGLDTPQLATVLPVLAFSLVASGFSSVPAMLLRKQLRFRELAMRSVLATVLSVIAAIVLALLGFGVWALVGQTIVRVVVAVVVLWRTTDFRPSRLYDRVEARAMIRYGLQSLAVSFGNQLRGQGEVFFIGALASPAAVGYWTVGGRLVNVLVDVCTSIITSTASPFYSRVQADSRRLARVLGASTAMGSLVMVPVLVLMSLTSQQVVPVVFGHHWVPAASVASVLAIRALVRALSQFNGTVLMSTGHPSSELIVTVTTLVLQIGVVLLLARHLVALGLALAACQAVGIPIRISLVRRFYQIPLSTYARSAVVCLAGGVAAGAVVLAQVALHLPGYAYVGLAVVLGGGVYLAVLMTLAKPLVVEALGLGRATLSRRRRRSRPVSTAV